MDNYKPNHLLELITAMKENWTEKIEAPIKKAANQKPTTTEDDGNLITLWS